MLSQLLQNESWYNGKLSIPLPQLYVQSTEFSSKSIIYFHILNIYFSFHNQEL